MLIASLTVLVSGLIAGAVLRSKTIPAQMTPAEEQKFDCWHSYNAEQKIVIEIKQ